MNEENPEKDALKIKLDTAENFPYPPEGIPLWSFWKCKINKYWVLFYIIVKRVAY